MKANLIFRCLYYFRQGWAGYFVFMFSALNTLTVTYYLAIDKIPVIKEIFSSFVIYVVAAVVLGLPILTLVGYIHFKKSYAFKAEADVAMEENPHTRRMLQNTETILEINYKLSELIIKLLNNEKLTEQESLQMKQLQQELAEHINKRIVRK